MIFELVYPFAWLMAAILLPVMITTPPQRERVVRRQKTKTIRKAKKSKTKAKGWYKTPALTPQQQAAIERYRLGGNRSQIEIGGVIPI